MKIDGLVEYLPIPSGKYPEGATEYVLTRPGWTGYKRIHVSVSEAFLRERTELSEQGDYYDNYISTTVYTYYVHERGKYGKHKRFVAYSKERPLLI